MKKIKKIYWRLAALKAAMPLIRQCADDNPNELNEQLLKKKPLIILELAAIKTIWNQQPHTYFSQKMERKDRSLRSDFISLRCFSRLQRNLDSPGRMSWVQLQRQILHEKLFFEHYIRAAGLPVVRTVILMWDHGHLVYQNKDRESSATCGTGKRGRFLFFKPSSGQQGRGVFVVPYEFNKLNAPTETEVPSPYIGQERIAQHSILSSFHTNSVNTLRLVTVRTSGDEISIFGCYFRCGCGGSIVDADSRKSKIICLISPQLGELSDKGIWLKRGSGHWVDRHPDSGKPFSGVSIPFWNDCVSLAKQSHEFFPNIGTIGWDIAITDAGPLLIEGNAGWSPTAFMWLMENFRQRCVDMGILSGM